MKMSKPLDTNVDHYKNSDYVMGVAIEFVDGSIFKTEDYTVNDINEAIHKDHDKWLKLKNGGAFCLDHVISYLPWEFYNRKRG